MVSVLSPKHLGDFFKTPDPNQSSSLRSHLQEGKITVTSRDAKERTALHYAASSGQTELIILLVESFNAPLDVQDFEGQTPLHNACSVGNAQVAKYLIDKGADLKKEDEKGHTALDKAVCGGYIACLEHLLASRPSILFEHKDKQGLTALHKAALYDKSQCLLYLLNKGAETEPKDREHQTPLHLAANSGHLHALQALLEAGAEVDAKDKKDQTPLHLACCNGNIACAKALLQQGASVEVITNRKQTPVHFAAMNGHLACLKCLIQEFNADMTHLDDKGLNALSYSKARGHDACSDFLSGKSTSLIQSAHVGSPSRHNREMKRSETLAPDWTTEGSRRRTLSASHGHQTEKKSTDSSRHAHQHKKSGSAVSRSTINRERRKELERESPQQSNNGIEVERLSPRHLKKPILLDRKSPRNNRSMEATLSPLINEGKESSQQAAVEVMNTIPTNNQDHLTNKSEEPKHSQNPSTEIQALQLSREKQNAHIQIDIQPSPSTDEKKKSRRHHHTDHDKKEKKHKHKHKHKGKKLASESTYSLDDLSKYTDKSETSISRTPRDKEVEVRSPQASSVPDLENDRVNGSHSALSQSSIDNLGHNVMQMSEHSAKKRISKKQKVEVSKTDGVIQVTKPALSYRLATVTAEPLSNGSQSVRIPKKQARLRLHEDTDNASTEEKHKKHSKHKAKEFSSLRIPTEPLSPRLGIDRPEIFTPKSRGTQPESSSLEPEQIKRQEASPNLEVRSESKETKTELSTSPHVSKGVLTEKSDGIRISIDSSVTSNSNITSQTISSPNLSSGRGKLERSVRSEGQLGKLLNPNASTTPKGSRILLAEVGRTGSLRSVARSARGSEDSRNTNNPNLQPVDRYGFVMKTPGKVEQHVNEKQEYEDAMKWAKELAKYRKNGAIPKSKKEHLKGKVARGIPDRVRSEVWKLLADSRLLQEQSAVTFEELLQDPSNDEEQIDKDVNRTFPGHVYFQQKAGQQDLFNVLKGYSNFRKDVGYCQGMAFIAALFLLHLDQEESFWLLAQLGMKYELEDIWKLKMDVMEKRFYVIDKLFEHLLPKIHAQFKSNGLEPIMYAPPWFMTIYLYTIPFPVALRVWDLFLFYGLPIVYFVGLALLKTLEDDLMKSRNIDGLMNTLSKINENGREIDPDQFVVLTLQLRNKLKHKVKAYEKEFTANAAKKEKAK